MNKPERTITLVLLKPSALLIQPKNNRRLCLPIRNSPILSKPVSGLALKRYQFEAVFLVKTNSPPRGLPSANQNFTCTSLFYQVPKQFLAKASALVTSSNVCMSNQSHILNR